jgi:hypothetical protein
MFCSIIYIIGNEYPRAIILFFIFCRASGFLKATK